eukprot:803355-Prymnesium_polylepis.1
MLKRPPESPTTSRAEPKPGKLSQPAYVGHAGGSAVRHAAIFRAASETRSKRSRFTSRESSVTRGRVT